MDNVAETELGQDEEQQLLKTLQGFVSELGVTLDQAFDFLGVADPDDRARYKEMLEHK